MEHKNIEDILALTPVQEGLLFHYLKNPGSDFYFEQLVLEIRGHLDRNTVQSAWNRVIEAHGMLRTVFRWEKLAQPIQIILKKHLLVLRYADFSGQDPREKRTTLERLKDKDRQEGFHLGKVPFRVSLFKMGEADFLVMISNHHILYDGWSSGIIIKEFVSGYHDLRRGQGQTPGKAPGKGFKEFVKWVLNRDVERQREFWHGYLAGLAGPTYISPGQKDGTATPQIAVFHDPFPRDWIEKMTDFVKTRRITTAALLYSAWGILLQKYTHSQDVVFGAITAGRSAGIKGIEHMVGLFMNTLPLRIKSHDHEQILHLLARTAAHLKLREAFENASLLEIKQDSGLDMKEELFDSIIGMENYPLEEALGQEGEIRIQAHSVFEATHYNLGLSIKQFKGIELIFRYKQSLWEKTSIEKMSRHLRNIIREIIGDSKTRVAQIDMLAREEKHRILMVFNGRSGDFTGNRGLAAMMANQARSTPDRAALVFEKQQNRQFTFGKLEHEARQLARTLKAKGLKAGEIVGLMVPASPEMVVGLWGTLLAGAAYLPIETQLPGKRIAAMLKDCSVSILLTAAPNVERKRKPLEPAPGFQGETLRLDNLPPCTGAEPAGSHDPYRPHDWVYVIYTSGSTGQPKGVAITQRNLMPLLQWSCDYFSFTGNHRVWQNLKYTFDFGAFEVLTTLLFGGTLHFLDLGGVADLEECVDFIHRQGINTLHTTPGFFKTIIALGKKMPGLKTIQLGGERLAGKVVDDISKLVSPGCKIYNGYGPTETTIIATTFCWPGHGPNGPDLSTDLPIGKPSAHNWLYILDTFGQCLPVGAAGEIYIGGSGVAPGYLNQPGLTAERFMENPYRPGETFYRTGDWGRWQPAGNIEFLGRIDHQVKIRGHRIELGEIEYHLATHGKIKEAVVLAVEQGQQEQGKVLAAYLVGQPGLDRAELRDHLARRLPDYMIPSYFILIDHIPLTPNGKIDRKALPALEPPNEPGHDTAPRNELEKKLAEIWAAVLEIQPETLGIDMNFFQCGGHSLKAAALSSRIHKELHIKVPLVKLFEMPTLREIAGYMQKMAETGPTSPPALNPLEKREYYPLSSAQKRFFILDQARDRHTAYNLPMARLVEGEFHRQRLRQALQTLVNRHESLRTWFEVIAGEPAQRIKEKNFKFPITDYTQSQHPKLQMINTPGETPAEDKEISQPSSFIHPLLHHFIRPFDLARAPLLRVGWSKLAEKKYLLLVDLHHIIADGLTAAILIKELIALLENRQENLAVLPLQYRDYAQWQNRGLAGPELEKQGRYWEKQFKNGIPALDLPLDFPRPPARDFAGDRIAVPLDSRLAQRLRAGAAETGTTLFMLLLAVLNVLLAKYARQPDIVVGSPVSGRNHARLESIVGVFINTLTLGNRCEDHLPFETFLNQVKQNALAAYENQDYPFDELVERLKIPKQPGRNPLFDVMIVVENETIPGLDVEGLRSTPIEFNRRISHLDLVFYAVESHDTIKMEVEYAVDLFHASTVREMANHFLEILQQVLAAKRIPLKEIRLSHRLLVPDKNNPALELVF